MWKESTYPFSNFNCATTEVSWGGWGWEVSCGGHHRLKGKTTTGSALDGAVFDIAQILAYLVHNMSRSNYTWGLAILAYSLLFSVNNILAAYGWIVFPLLKLLSFFWLTYYCSIGLCFSVRVQLSLFRSTCKLIQSLLLQWFVKLMGPSLFSFIILIGRLWVIYVREDNYSNV